MKKDIIHGTGAIYEYGHGSGSGSGRRSADKGSTPTDGTERIIASISAEAALITTLGGIAGGLDYLVLSLQSSGCCLNLRAVKDKLIQCFLGLAAEVYSPAERGVQCMRET